MGLNIAKTKVNVLGQPYTVVLTDSDKEPLLSENYGFCDYHNKKICLNIEGAVVHTNNNVNTVIHELIHAFLFESGLEKYVNDEILVSWMAHTIPKLEKALDILAESGIINIMNKEVIK